MTLTKQDIFKIEERLDLYDKIFEKIFVRFDRLDNEVKVKKAKRKKSLYGNNDKIYLSIAGLTRSASIDNK